MDQARIAEGYNSRMKSQWVCEAIELLSERDKAFTTVGLGEAHERFNTKLCISISPGALAVIKRAKMLIRREDPESEFLTGQIIRAAIRYRNRKAIVR